MEAGVCVRGYVVVRVRVGVCLCMSVYEERWRACQCVGARLELGVAGLGRNEGLGGVWDNINVTKNVYTGPSFL